MDWHIEGHWLKIDTHTQVRLNCMLPIGTLCSVTQLCPTLCINRLLCPWDFSGKNIGMGCHFLCQRIFPTQGSNSHLLCFLHWQVGSLPLAPPGKPYRKVASYIKTQKEEKIKDRLSYNILIKMRRKLERLLSRFQNKEYYKG